MFRAQVSVRTLQTAPTDMPEGYKMRTLLAKSLQTRSKAIRRAIAEFNTAAGSLSPPREPINWSDMSPYGFVEQFAMLRNTRNDIREKPWSKPLYREFLKLRNRIARAKEEVLRCNVETRRLQTSIYDETVLFSKTLDRLRASGDPMYGQVQEFVRRRKCVNYMLLKRIKQIHCLAGFTGDKTRGVSVHAPDDLPNEPTPIEEDETPSSGEEDEEEDEGDESCQQMSGIINFMVASVG